MIKKYIQCNFLGNSFTFITTLLNEFLKHAADKLMPVFVKIFNIIFESGIVPDSWSEGYICSIFKNKGDRNL
jgi:hypothetical protein